jgi:tetratricopeptide (TPR) repeat protein
MPRLRLFSLLFVLGSALNAHADGTSVDNTVADLGHRWAEIYYKMPEAQKDAAYAELIVKTQQASTEFPKNAEPLIWQAIALSSAAKVEGGLSALRKAISARELLVAAEAINPTAMNGSIYSSLGSLYAKVPGWPIGFGDRRKAKTCFEKALAIDPNSIDANYFYADYLVNDGDYAKAAEHLKSAVAAPPRPGREDADAGRRQEALAMLDMLKQKHADQLATN